MQCLHRHLYILRHMPCNCMTSAHGTCLSCAIELAVHERFMGFVWVPAIRVMIAPHIIQLEVCSTVAVQQHLQHNAILRSRRIVSVPATLPHATRPTAYACQPHYFGSDHSTLVCLCMLQLLKIGLQQLHRVRGHTKLRVFRVLRRVYIHVAHK